MNNNFLMNLETRFESFRNMSGVEVGRISKIIGTEGIFCVLVNKRWKYEHLKDECVTDLEKVIAEESGFYIKMWIAYLFQNSEFGNYQHLPFPNWDLSLKELSNSLDNSINLKIAKYNEIKLFLDNFLPEKNNIGTNLQCH